MQELNSSTKNWNPPIPLEEEVHLYPWPDNVYPEPFNAFIHELSRSTETPIELSAALILAMVATAVQTSFQVQIKEDYYEPLCLWVLPILPPGERKSRVYTEISLPLKEWELEQKKLMEPIIQSAASKNKTMEVRLKELRNKAAKVEGSNFSAIQQQIESLEKEMTPIPSHPRIWTGDITPEHLGTLMALNQECASVLNDEGGIFSILAGLYSDGNPNIDLVLQGHAASPVRVDRGSRESVVLNRPVLTIGITVQPQTIKEICSNKTFRGRGLLGRFLYVMPKSKIGLRTLEEPPISQEVVIQYRQIVKTLLNLRQTKDKQQLRNLKLSVEAYQKWKEYAKLIEKLMGEEIGKLTHMTDWAGKLAGAIGRIAGLIHCMRYANDNPVDHEISFTDMHAAVKIGHCLTSHAIAVFDLLHQDGVVPIGRQLLNWIKYEKRTQFKFRDLQRKFRRFKKNELEPVLTLLKEHEILQEWEYKPDNGRPSRLFEVNPLIFETEDSTKK
jgi:hypothetical protein